MPLNRENPLWKDIQAQGANLRQVIDHLYGAEYENLEAAVSFLKNDKPIVFIGMTSAAYLCHPAEHYLGSLGRLATVMQASDALYSQLPALRNANVVFNSRSGETAEIVKLAKALKEEEIPFVAMTNVPDSTLAQTTDHVLWVNSRHDDLVSINIVTAMIVATLILAAEAQGQGEALKSDLEQLPAMMDRVVETAWQQAGTLFDMFGSVNPIYLLHRGGSKGAANCARLVIEEVSRRPAIAMESGEFRQGPIEVVDENFGAMVYVLDGTMGWLNCQLAGDIRASKGKVYLIGNEDACDGNSSVSFETPGRGSIFQPVFELVPAQVLAYKLAEAQGLEPGSMRYISRVITTETGLPGDA